MNPTTHNSPSAAPGGVRNRNRLMLIAIFAIFFGPILLAWVLNANHVIPGAKTAGERLQPIVDLRTTEVRLADGSRYAWAPAQRMRRMLVIAPPACGAPCARQAADLDKLRAIFGKDAEHLELLWMGPYPEGAPRPSSLRLLADDPALRAKLPRASDAKGAPVYVIDPYGFVILRYAPGFDVSLMRKDLAKLLKMQ